jgi:hypothetical protein
MSLAERSDILDEMRLPAVPKTVANYHRLVDLLNAMIDQVGEDNCPSGSPLILNN